MPGAQWESCGFDEEDFSKISLEKKATFVQSCLNGHTSIKKTSVVRGALAP